MPWPSFPFPFALNDYMNPLSNFPHPLFPGNLGNTSLFNSLLTQLNYSNSLSLYPTVSSQIQRPQDKSKDIFPFRGSPFCSNKTDNVILNHSQMYKKQSQLNKPIIKQNKSAQDIDIRMVRFRRRRTSNKPKNLISHNSSLRNDTKNIPKNYGKAMLTYIQKNTRQVKNLLEKHQVDFTDFMIVVKSFKSKINTIHDLRQMWGQNQKQNQIKICIRILSYYFMRKKCLPYIFNSRIKNYKTHIKYRKKIMEGIKNPQNFTKIKQF